MKLILIHIYDKFRRTLEWTLLIPDLKIILQKHHFENIYGALAKIARKEISLFIVLFYCCELLGRTQCEEVTSGAGAIERQLHALLYHAEDSKFTN